MRHDEPKRPTMQCQVGLYFLSNSFLMKAAMSFSMLYFSSACGAANRVLLHVLGHVRTLDHGLAIRHVEGVWCQGEVKTASATGRARASAHQASGRGNPCEEALAGGAGGSSCRTGCARSGNCRGRAASGLGWTVGGWSRRARQRGGCEALCPRRHPSCAPRRRMTMCLASSGSASGSAGPHAAGCC